MTSTAKALDGQVKKLFVSTVLGEELLIGGESAFLTDPIIIERPYLVTCSARGIPRTLRTAIVTSDVLMIDTIAIA